MKQRNPQFAELEQKTQGVQTVMLLVMLVLLIQLWLVTIALEEFLAANHTLAVPTLLASGFCFLVNLVLLRYVNDIDRTTN